MAYRLEGKDIVITGFEQGIADSVYAGVADMRNIEIMSVPGEASVEPSLVAVTAPPVMNAVAFTAQNTGDTITMASTSGLYNGAAIVLNTNSAGGLSTGIVYYVMSLTATTFQVRLAPAAGSAVVISSDGSGTLTTYQYSGSGTPISYWVDRTGSLSSSNGTFLVDSSNRVWVILTSAQSSLAANTLYFLGNIGSPTSPSRSGIVVWNDYLILFRSTDTDVVDIGEAWAGTGPAAEWIYSWESVSCQSTNARIGVISSQEDGAVYFTSVDGLGSLIETPGDNFDPTDTASYVITDEALLIPSSDEATCLAELGTSILIGGRNSFVYTWNKIDPGFTTLLNVPDTFISNIIATTQNAYVFAGTRGRIYITNGSGMDLFKKFPDYLTGSSTIPYIRWQDANFGRNQLYFSITAIDIAGTDLTTVAGIWAIDLKTEALRMVNKITPDGYTGIVRMVAERPSANSSSPTDGLLGNGLQCAWYISGVGTPGVAVAQTSPYTAYESYLHTEMIPVGTFLDPFTPSQIEWKTSAPLVAGEGIRISYRTNITEAFTQLGESTTAGAISDLFKANFQKVQWVQFKVELKSTATTPSYTRLTEMRIRDWPSGKGMK